jgi:hypothetical protein
MLEQSHDSSCKSLVGETVTNVIQFFEVADRLQGNQVICKYCNKQGHPEDSCVVRSSFSQALEFEGRESSRADLCTLVVQNADILYPYHSDLSRRLFDLVRAAGRPQSPASAERIIQAATTVTNWCRKSVSEGQQRQREESFQYCKLILGHLMDLVRISIAP